MGLLADKRPGAMIGGASEDLEDGPTPAPMPIEALRPIVPFNVYRFVHWAPGVFNKNEGLWSTYSMLAPYLSTPHILSPLVSNNLIKQVPSFQFIDESI